MAGSMGLTRRRSRKVKSEPSQSISDYYREMLGYRTSMRPFFTSANVECGTCRQIKPGTEFPQPITPPAACLVCSHNQGKN